MAISSGVAIVCALLALVAVGAYAEFAGGQTARRNRRRSKPVGRHKYVARGGPIRQLAFQSNDGGRKAAGYKGKAGDCVVRAISIAAELPYQQVYDSVNKHAERERTGKRKRGKSNPRTGVYKGTTHRLLESLGWTWTPTMEIGSGCRVHLRAGELPAGRLVVSVSGHLTAVIDGVIQDTHDPSRRGTRCVYGYWQQSTRAKATGAKQCKA